MNYKYLYSRTYKIKYYKDSCYYLDISAYILSTPPIPPTPNSP